MIKFSFSVALAQFCHVPASAASLNTGWNGGGFKNGLGALLEGNGRLERTGLPAGTYFIKVKTGTITSTQRFTNIK